MCNIPGGGRDLMPSGTLAIRAVRFPVRPSPASLPKIAGEATAID